MAKRVKEVNEAYVGLKSYDFILLMVQGYLKNKIPTQQQCNEVDKECDDYNDANWDVIQNGKQEDEDGELDPDADDTDCFDDVDVC